MRLIPDEAIGILTVWAEAEGEPYVGKVAVAEVIQRRAKLKYNSDGTIAGTVARRYQFSFFNDDAQDNARLIAALKLDDGDLMVGRCRAAWNEALQGAELVPDAVLYYRAGSPVPPWAVHVVLVGQVGNHLFFKDPHP